MAKTATHILVVDTADRITELRKILVQHPELLVLDHPESGGPAPEYVTVDTKGAHHFDTGEQKGFTIVRTYPKVGRNAPCPCGSGVKAKKCVHEHDDTTTKELTP